MDDKIDDMYNTSFIRFGVGRAHCGVFQEVRAGDIDIEEARQLIKKYSGEYPKRYKKICEWLTIDPDEFPESRELIENLVFTEEYFAELYKTDTVF